MATSRSAWLAGSTGLVGRALLPLLLQGDAYAQVHALVRRSGAGIAPHPKLQLQQVDFAQLPDTLPHCDDVYIALGTTIKTAGSQAAFRAVDFDAVVATARAARRAGATRLAVASALGADAGSRVFYSRVKGEMEQAVAELGYASVLVVQPSLLAGDRAALGQPTRAGEKWAMRLLRPVLGLVPRSVRPIEATTVAHAMLRALLAAPPGVRRLSSAEMQQLGR
jgi:uncharacterized protein YbjT (DUF2867 family)